MIANDENPSETVGGIMALSKVVVVSEESVSMISEAVSAGKRVVVFTLTKKTAKRTKHERMLERLQRDGFIRLCDPRNLTQALAAAWSDTTPPKQLPDRDTIYTAVRRLI